MQTDYESYPRSETWIAWNVNWSAIWVGAIASLSAALIFGLLGTAVGAASLENSRSLRAVSLVDAAVVICSAFFSFVIGGWVAGKITGARHSEPTILHAVIAWLVATSALGHDAGSGRGQRIWGLVWRFDRLADRRTGHAARNA